MKTAQELYQERITRLRKAIALEKPDRTPVMAWADGFCANYLGVKMSEYSAYPYVAAETTLSFFKEFPTFDATELEFTPPDMVSLGFLSKMKIAGRDLPEGSCWIVDEQERLTTEDYDRILEMGWDAFNAKFIAEKFQIPQEYFGQVFGAMAMAGQKFYENGIPVYTMTLGSGIPLETLAGGRTMAKFIKDLFRMPDKVQAVMDVIMDARIKNMKNTFAQMPKKPFSIFVGIARGASEFLSPKLWQRFVLPYMVRIVNTVIDEGMIANLHFDSNWERDLEYLKQFPKGTCVFACDHSTDIYKIKEVLGDTMCIKGDVPSPMLAFGTPDDVYNYSTKLIRDMGNGFILAPACTLPANAKIENVKAMLAAVEG